jgi:laminin alpha 3/5
VQIDLIQVNLNKNVNAYGIISGCPEKVTFIILEQYLHANADNNIELHFQIASLVSFEPGSRGYVKLPNATASDNYIDLILRFKTNVPDGLLVYGADGPSVFSLRMESGILTFKSGGTQVSSTQATLYNDDQWHVVFIAHTPQQLMLLVDDFDSFQYVIITILTHLNLTLTHTHTHMYNLTENLNYLDLIVRRTL